MPSVFTWIIRVYYEDTDTGGIVYYANYLKFFERARTEWLRAAGIGQHGMLERDGAGFVVRSARIDYHASAVLDDEITLTLTIAKLGRASVEFVQQARRGDLLLAEATVKVGCIDMSTRRPRAIPHDAAAKMSVI